MPEMNINTYRIKNIKDYVRKVSLNELIVILPLEGFKFKIYTPLFNIDGISPAKIKLLAVIPNMFLIKILTPEYNLVTLIPSFVLEVFNPEGVRIIKIVAPREMG